MDESFHSKWSNKASRIGQHVTSKIKLHKRIRRDVLLKIKQEFGIFLV